MEKEIETEEIEKIDEVKEETKNEQKNEKKRFTILGISIWRIFAYFIIYSVLGYIIETLFGIVTKGVWESRQSFLYGPFCAIYGVGAVIMIVFLHKYYKNYNRLFIFGFIIGSIVEYFVSLFGEMILHVKWWDYSDMPLDINGRICVYFSIFWGFLAMYLICSVNPKIDKLIDWFKTKFSIKTLKIVTMTTIIVLFIDCVITGIAVNFFLIRMKVENNLDVPEKEAIAKAYDDIYSNEKLSNFIYRFFDNRTILRTFPNLKVQEVDGNIVYMDSLLPDIQPYYLKVHNKNPHIKTYNM